MEQILKRQLYAARLLKILSPLLPDPGGQDLYSQNVPLDPIQYLSGHAYPRTTQIYDLHRQCFSRNIVDRISA